MTSAILQNFLFCYRSITPPAFYVSNYPTIQIIDVLWRRNKGIAQFSQFFLNIFYAEIFLFRPIGSIFVPEKCSLSSLWNNTELCSLCNRRANMTSIFLITCTLICVFRNLLSRIYWPKAIQSYLRPQALYQFINVERKYDVSPTTLKFSDKTSTDPKIIANLFGDIILEPDLDYFCHWITLHKPL